MAIPKSRHDEKPDIPYSEFVALVNAPHEAKHIEEVEIKDREYTFQIKDPNSKATPQRSRTVGPAEDTRKRGSPKGVKVTYQKDEGSRS